MKALELCGPVAVALKRSIKKLENKLLIGNWQAEYLQKHKPFWPFQPALDDTEAETDTIDNANRTQVVPLPPAGNLIVYDRDCSELFDRLRPPSGFYRIRPKPHQDAFLAYCDMADGGGWTVFQRRKNLVKIDLMDWDGQRSYAFYENFKITDEADKYRLQYGVYSGKAGDALTGGGGMVEQWSACLSGMQFSTRDQVSAPAVVHHVSCSADNANDDSQCVYMMV
ncbi:Fibrinogen-like protein 1 [Liparis tanakae]|uniref:Fibrinogen-like protein 1 n=1 Tax=Liparis tanakae TaxID=230148 RepID=A0A4Z2IMB7_9TELE|nr:Fibrinogen-like protein 1 [Liparis tanakae]